MSWQAVSTFLIRNRQSRFEPPSAPAHPERTELWNSALQFQPSCLASLANFGCQKSRLLDQKIEFATSPKIAQRPDFFGKARYNTSTSLCFHPQNLVGVLHQR